MRAAVVVAVVAVVLGVRALPATRDVRSPDWGVPPEPEATPCEQLLSDHVLRLMCGVPEWAVWGENSAEEVCLKHLVRVESNGCNPTCFQLARLWRRNSGCDGWVRRLLWPFLAPVDARCVALRDSLNRIKCVGVVES